jgi:hypothetical protein
MLLDQEYFCSYGLFEKMMPSCYSCFLHKNHDKAVLSCQKDKNDIKSFIIWDLSKITKNSNKIQPVKIKAFQESSNEEVLKYIYVSGYKLTEYVAGFWENSSGVPSDENEIEVQNKIEMDAYRRFIERSLFSDTHLSFRIELLFNTLIDSCRKNEIHDSWSPKRRVHRPDYYNGYGYYFGGYNPTYSQYPTINDLEKSRDDIDKLVFETWITWRDAFLYSDKKNLIAPELYYQSYWTYSNTEYDKAISSIIDHVKNLLMQDKSSMLAEWDFS